MTEHTILVIDDEHQVHRFLRPALKAEGYMALGAETAQHGLHLAATRNVEAVWHRDGVEIDLVRRRVKVDGDVVAFTPLEYDLLAFLVRSAGRVVTHRQLLTSVWGKAHVDDVQYLRVYIGHIRQKLGAEGGAFVGTEAGVGYRFADMARAA